MPATARAVVLRLCPNKLRAARFNAAQVAAFVKRGAHCREASAWPVAEDPPLVVYSTRLRSRRRPRRWLAALLGPENNF